MDRDPGLRLIWATSLVLTAALICWIRAFLNVGGAGYAGIAVVLLAAGWIFRRRTSDRPPPEQPLLAGGLIALAGGIVALVLT